MRRTTSPTPQALIAAYHRTSRRSPRSNAAALVDVVALCQFQYGISFLDYYWGVERDRPKADWAWDTFVLGHAQLVAVARRARR